MFHTCDRLMDSLLSCSGLIGYRILSAALLDVMCGLRGRIASHCRPGPQKRVSSQGLCDPDLVILTMAPGIGTCYTRNTMQVHGRSLQVSLHCPVDRLFGYLMQAHQN